MRACRASLAAVGLLVSLPTVAYADSFEFDIGATYDALDRSSSVRPNLQIPLPSQFLGSDSETDEFGVSAAWFFDGVNLSTGPRSRAAFLSQASSISFSYTRIDGRSTTLLGGADPTVPATVDRFDSQADLFSAELRYVLPEHGWYGLAGLSREEFKSGTPSGNFRDDNSRYSLGIGRYVGERTTLDLRVSRFDQGGGLYSTETTLSLSHIGDLGNWQYGVDSAITTFHASGPDEQIDLGFSLYPSRSIAVGLSTTTSLQDPFDTFGTPYRLFASWFPTESVELAARFSLVDFDDSGNSVENDQETLGIGIRVRF